jgi:hypothetical protein
MTWDTTLCCFAPADVEDSIAALCVIASVAHAVGDAPRRDDAVCLAAEMATGLVSDVGYDARAAS